MGKTQSGKSTLARAIVDQWHYSGGQHGLSLVVMDPKADDQLHDWYGPPITPDSLAAGRIAYGEWPPVIHWVPAYGDAKGIEQMLRRVFARGNVVLWINELAVPKVIDAHTWPPSLAACYGQGARRHIGVLAETQDPVRVPVFTRSQAEHKIVFRIQHGPYLEDLSADCNCDMSAAAGLLPYHSLLASERLDPSVPQPVHLDPLEV